MSSFSREKWTSELTDELIEGHRAGSLTWHLQRNLLKKPLNDSCKSKSRSLIRAFYTPAYANVSSKPRTHPIPPGSTFTQHQSLKVFGYIGMPYIIQQNFIEQLLCAKHCARCLGHNNKPNRPFSVIMDLWDRMTGWLLAPRQHAGAIIGGWEMEQGLTGTQGGESLLRGHNIQAES